LTSSACVIGASIVITLPSMRVIVRSMSTLRLVHGFASWSMPMSWSQLVVAERWTITLSPTA
jgi:hypothetical protein